jgi:hypothetical protein
MKKLVVVAAVVVALASAGSASAFPAIPPSCSNPFQVTCEFVTGGTFVKSLVRCTRLYVPGGPYVCRTVRPVI